MVQFRSRSNSEHEESKVATKRDTSATLHCKDCVRWYGGEDDEYGPCGLKHERGDKKYVTFGMQECDEPEMLATLKMK